MMSVFVFGFKLCEASLSSSGQLIENALVDEHFCVCTCILNLPFT